jgi:hypothetical protein
MEIKNATPAKLSYLPQELSSHQTEKHMLIDSSGKVKPFFQIF